MSWVQPQKDNKIKYLDPFQNPYQEEIAKIVNLCRFLSTTHYSPPTTRTHSVSLRLHLHLQLHLHLHLNPHLHLHLYLHLHLNAPLHLHPSPMFTIVPQYPQGFDSRIHRDTESRDAPVPGFHVCGYRGLTVSII